jgi:hypothetical protein
MSDKIKVYDRMGVDLVMENKDLFRENARLRSQLAKVQASVDQLVEDVLTLKRKEGGRWQAYV